jgi:hypothetical protein
MDDDKDEFKDGIVEALVRLAVLFVYQILLSDVLPHEFE